MNNETLQEAADRLKNFQGNVKGAVFCTYTDYIKFKEGEEGVERVEKRMNQLGVPINFSSIKSFEWVSEGISALTVVTAKDTFNWTDEDIFEMGRFAPRVSFIIKMMIQYLTSVDAVLKNAAKYWGKHFDFGSLETEYKEGEHKIIIREKDYKVHPLMSVYHAGYFKGLCEFAVKSKKIDIKQIASVYEGADCNEYLLKWE